MANTSGQDSGPLPKNSRIVKVNGIDMYYEIFGKGEPLLLLHGWTQSSKFWSEFIEIYAHYFEVYAIDLRGHGNTSPITSSFTIQESAKDILELLEHLKLNKVKAIGLSYGGLTLLELANLYPGKLESVILIGTSHTYNGGENNKEYKTFSFESLPPSFIKELNKNHHHGEAQIRALFDPTLNYQIALSEEQLNKFKFRTLIVQGDRDKILGVEPAFTLYKNIPNSALWIVPNTGYIAIGGSNKENFLATSLQFMSGQY